MRKFYKLQQTIQLSLPSKGRLETDALEFLSAAGLRVTSNPIRANTKRNFPLCLNWASSSNAPVISSSVCARAVLTLASPASTCSKNMAAAMMRLLILHDSLGFGSCSLKLAIPETWKTVTDVASLKEYASSLETPLRVATKFPFLTERFLRSTQYCPLADLCRRHTRSRANHRVCRYDLRPVSSGQTYAVDNRLRPLTDGVIQKSQAVLIANRKALQNPCRSFGNGAPFARIYRSSHACRR